MHENTKLLKQFQRYPAISTTRTKREKDIVESVSASLLDSRKIVGLGMAAETSHRFTDDGGSNYINLFIICEVTSDHNGF